MGLDYSLLTPVLTGGIKELHHLLEEQQKQIEALQEEVERLKQKD